MEKIAFWGLCDKKHNTVLVLLEIYKRNSISLWGEMGGNAVCRLFLVCAKAQKAERDFIHHTPLAFSVPITDRLPLGCLQYQLKAVDA